MKTIDQKIVGVLRDSSSQVSTKMREAQKVFENAKNSGFISPHAYDIPLMSRLSSRYVGKNEKIAAVTTGESK